MADEVNITGSSVFVPGANTYVPGLDTVQNLAVSINSVLSKIKTELTNALSNVSVNDATRTIDINKIQDAVAKVNESLVTTTKKTESDLQLAIKDLQDKFYKTQTSSQPTTGSAKTGGGSSWLILVGAFLVVWFIMEKKRPL